MKKKRIVDYSRVLLRSRVQVGKWNQLNRICERGGFSPTGLTAYDHHHSTQTNCQMSSNSDLVTTATSNHSMEQMEFISIEDRFGTSAPKAVLKNRK